MILLLTALIALPTVPQSQGSGLEARADSIMARQFPPGGPGCVLGVAKQGRTVLEKAWGQADLERGIPLSTASILEAGSVSKQFTAALVLLLAREGVLSLDDDVRRWLPELPPYATPVTLRHMIHHTSGLRDWGNISGIGGWPRNTRALSHAHVLDIVRRIRELNFPPGTEYDYSNSNYNLLAMVAERAAGRSFPALTREKLFLPLGMRNTSWRDDALRVVPGRALSFSRVRDGWRGEYATENIFGNCCLLTTAADLLRWNTALDSNTLGIRDEQERTYTLASGRISNYAAGLLVGRYRGTRYVDHDGATAGYRAYLGRFPEKGVSVALLCNAGTANPEQLALDIITPMMNLPPAPQFAPPARAQVPQAAIDDKAGLYRSVRTMGAQRFVVREGRLQTEGGIELIPQSESEFAAERGGNRVLFVRRPDGRYDARHIAPGGMDTVPAEWVEEPDTSRAALDRLIGTYVSEEANAELRIMRDSTGTLVLFRGPDTRWVLRPSYRDGFASPIGNLAFDREGFRLTQPRVRNLRFRRV